MKLIVAQGSGFCSGVKRAVELVYEHTDGSSKLYSIGPFVHNAQAIAEMEKRGLVIEESVDDLESDAIVIIRSHGVPEMIYEKLQAKGIKIVDATCHFVKKIHNLVKELSKKGYAIIIVGEKEHPEVIGITGWVESDCFVINDLEAIESLPELPKVCVVAQTTLNHYLWETVIKSLSSKYENLKIYNTICNATGDRQREAKAIGSIASTMFVVGGKTSSNTQKLYEICKTVCANTFLIETAAEIDASKILFDEIVGITAGASTPDWVVEEVLDKISNLQSKIDEPNLTQNVEQTATADTQASETPQEMEMKVEMDKLYEKFAEAHQTIVEESVITSDRQESEDLNTMEDFHKTMVVLRTGEIVKGKIISVSANEIIVNLGYKSDGILPVSEVLPGTFKPGDDGEFEIVKVNDGDGNVILSRKTIEKKLSWDKIELSMNEGLELEGICTEAVKGGVIATVLSSIKAFVPASQISTEFVSDLTTFIGRPLRLKVLEIDKRRNRLVASQRVVIEAEMASKRKSFFETISEGQTIKGTVMRLTDFGAFVDIGGIDGLIRIPDLSWSRIGHPKEILKEGQQIEVVVLSINKEKEKIGLGYKQINPHPWDNIETRYATGSIVNGKVARIAPFGAFIELEPGVDGLVHISQISKDRVLTVDKVLSVGQMISAKILKVDPIQRKISLSIKEAEVQEENTSELPEQIDSSPELAKDLEQ